MEEGPLLSKWWVKESVKFVPYLNISARLDDRPDQTRFEEYGLRGFPSFLFLDSSGTLLHGKEPYWRPDSPQELQAGLEEVEFYYALLKKVKDDPDDRVASASLTLWQGILNPIAADVTEMDAAMRVEGVDGDLIEKWKLLRTDTRFLVFFDPYREAFRNKSDDRQKFRKAAIEGSYAMWKEGVRPTDEWIRPFVVLSFDGAVEAKDVKVAGECVEQYEELYGLIDRFLKTMKARYEVLVESTGSDEVGSVGGGR